jgi:DNA-binding transcriptional MerR regulator
MNRSYLKRIFVILSVLVLGLTIALIATNLKIEKESDGNGYRIISLREKIAEQDEAIDDQQRKQEQLQDNVYRLNLVSRNEFGITVSGDKANYMTSLQPHVPFTGGPSDNTKYGWGSTCKMGDEKCETIYLLKVVDGQIQIIDSISLVDLGVVSGDVVEAWYAPELIGSETLVPSSPRFNSPAYWRQSTGLAIAITHVDGGASGAIIK